MAFEPLTYAGAVRQRVSGAPVQQVFKLVKHNQARLLRRVQDVEQRHRLMLQRQASEIGQGLLEELKEVASQVCQRHGGIDVQPDSLSRKRPFACLSLRLRVAVDQRGQRRFAHAADARQHQGRYIPIAQFRIDRLHRLIALLDGARVGRRRHTHDAAIGSLIKRSGLRHVVGRRRIDSRYMHNNLLRRLRRDLCRLYQLRQRGGMNNGHRLARPARRDWKQPLEQAHHDAQHGKNDNR